ncbi:MAG: nucleolar RNA-binding Nop10p family protein [Candidatus Woesearchaeota archaeon]
MAEHLHHCKNCDRYTLNESCPSCHTLTEIPRPPKFSLEDKYAGMRRELKKPEFIQKGWY